MAESKRPTIPAALERLKSRKVVSSAIDPGDGIMDSCVMDSPVTSTPINFKISDHKIAMEFASPSDAGLSMGDMKKLKQGQVLTDGQDDNTQPNNKVQSIVDPTDDEENDKQLNKSDKKRPVLLNDQANYKEPNKTAQKKHSGKREQTDNNIAVKKLSAEGDEESDGKANPTKDKENSPKVQKEQQKNAFTKVDLMDGKGNKKPFKEETKQAVSLDADKQADSLDANKQADSLDADKQADSLDADKQADSLDTDKKADSLDADKQADRLDTDKKADSLDADKKADSLDAEESKDSSPKKSGALEVKLDASPAAVEEQQSTHFSSRRTSNGDRKLQKEDPRKAMGKGSPDLKNGEMTKKESRRKDAQKDATNKGIASKEDAGKDEKGEAGARSSGFTILTLSKIVKLNRPDQEDNKEDEDETRDDDELTTDEESDEMTESDEEREGRQRRLDDDKRRRRRHDEKREDGDEKGEKRQSRKNPILVNVTRRYGLRPTFIPDFARKIHVRGKGRFRCEDKSHGQPLRWTSMYTWVLINLKTEKVMKKYKQKCKECGNWVKPSFGRDVFRDMCHIAVLKYRKKVMHPMHRRVASKEEVETKHETSLCERCVEMKGCCMMEEGGKY